MNLVIVESPAKAKTIESFLGKDYKVLASFGHVRDLPEKELGIDTENNFEPKYVVAPKAKKTISELSKYAKDAEILYLATDLDREGEAISWHLLYALKIKENDPKIKRIVFHEITKSAIENAVKNPRSLDNHLIDAQQARRVLDRLVGYKLSPLLWKKVKAGLSAGRVQSVAVRLIVEREREIREFKPEEYWVLAVDLSKMENEQLFRAFLIERNGKEIKKLGIKDKVAAEEIVAGLKGAAYQVLSVDKKEALRRPSAPFVTSTLQMEASRKLGYSAKQTMRLAQSLYEAGHITYMRTDSTNLSDEAVKVIRSVIKARFGEKYLPPSAQQYQTKTKRAQEAHEAIRPTHFDPPAGGLKVSEDGREQKLYDLIWKRTVASQMNGAMVEVVEARIKAEAKDQLVFLAKGERVVFDGFIKLYTEGRDDEVELGVNILPELQKDEFLQFHNLLSEQKFTEPPKRYSEATLVKKLESLGIGRPSTYAPTLSTIQDRGYVELVEKRFMPSEIGEIVTDLLIEHFANIVDYQFTARMEDEFDEIASGEQEWVPVIREFYTPFSKNLDEKMKSIEKPIVVSDTPCPHCGKMMLVKFGRMGKFLACPEEGSKVTLPLPEEAAEIKELQEKTKGEICPLCGKLLEVKRGRFGYFLGCTDYPKCKGIMKIFNKTGFKCPNCKVGEVVEKKSRGRGKIFYACSRWPDCTFLMNAKPENEAQLVEALQHWKDNPPKPRAYKPKYKAGANKKSKKS